MSQSSFQATTRWLQKLLISKYLKEDARSDVQYMIALHESREYRLDRYSPVILLYPFLLNPTSPAGMILRAHLGGFSGDLLQRIALEDSKLYENDIGRSFSRAVPYSFAKGPLSRASKYIGGPLSSGALLTAVMLYCMDPVDSPSDAEREREILRRLHNKLPLTPEGGLEISVADTEIAKFLLDRKIDPNRLAMRLHGYGDTSDDPDSITTRFSLAITAVESGWLSVQIVERWGKHQVVDKEGLITAPHGLWLPESILFLPREIQEFERILNRTPPAPEEVYQEFFEAHPKWLYLLGEQYEANVSQARLPPVQIHQELALLHGGVEEMWLKPDFLLKRIGMELWDVLDIKPAHRRMVVGRKSRRRFSEAVADAVAQLGEYRRRLAQNDVRAYLQRETGVTVCEPTAMVVVGRDSSFRNLQEKASLNKADSVRVYTYDDLLRMAKHRAIGVS